MLFCPNYLSNVSNALLSQKMLSKKPQANRKAAEALEKDLFFRSLNPDLKWKAKCVSVKSTDTASSRTTEGERTLK